MHSLHAPLTRGPAAAEAAPRMSKRVAPAAWAARAATAALLKKQKPIADADSAWWPGGLTTAAPEATSPLQPRLSLSVHARLVWPAAVAACPAAASWDQSAAKQQVQSNPLALPPTPDAALLDSWSCCCCAAVLLLHWAAMHRPLASNTCQGLACLATATATSMLAPAARRAACAVCRLQKVSAVR